MGTHGWRCVQGLPAHLLVCVFLFAGSYKRIPKYIRDSYATNTLFGNSTDFIHFQVIAGVRDDCDLK